MFENNYILLFRMQQYEARTDRNSQLPTNESPLVGHFFSEVAR